jgi:hypothetical protein
MTFITYEEFARKHRYNKTQIMKLLKVNRDTLKNWERNNIEVLIDKREHGYIPFVSYEFLGKRK